MEKMVSLQKILCSLHVAHPFLFFFAFSNSTDESDGSSVELSLPSYSINKRYPWVGKMIHPQKIPLISCQLVLLSSSKLTQTSFSVNSFFVLLLRISIAQK